MYAALNVLFILLTLWLVPETKHVSLEHIERNLMKGRKPREIGAHDYLSGFLLSRRKPPLAVIFSSLYPLPL